MSDTERRVPRVLAIAGSDSSGGAGIQADIKTVTMLGGYAMTAITALTAQNTTGVAGVEAMAPDFVIRQIDCCLDDIGVDAVKIGMLGGAAIAQAVADRVGNVTAPIVFDPVMVATSGALLADAETIAAFARLMDGCAMVTPNLPELEALSGLPVDTPDRVGAAAQVLTQRHGCAVLAKGGHAAGDRVVDYFFPAEGRFASFEDARIDTRHTHGTGCTLSSAVATFLGHRMPPEHAVRLGRRFVRRAMVAAPGFGAGHGPLGHQAVRGA